MVLTVCLNRIESERFNFLPVVDCVASKRNADQKPIFTLPFFRFDHAYLYASQCVIGECTGGKKRCFNIQYSFPMKLNPIKLFKAVRYAKIIQFH